MFIYINVVTISYSNELTTTHAFGMDRVSVQS